MVMLPVDDDFEEWFRTTLPRARGVAKRISPSVDADDIAMEAFARALVRWPTVQGIEHRDAWLLRVVSNLAIDSVRKATRRERILAVQRIAGSVPPDDDAAADRLAVAIAVGRLSRRQREVITLRYLVGLPEAEVAATLGLSANTVKTHLTRALAALRGRLDGTWEEPYLAQ